MASILSRPQCVKLKPVTSAHTRSLSTKQPDYASSGIEEVDPYVTKNQHWISLCFADFFRK